MKRIFLFLVVLLIVAWSCTKKKYPESISENAPIFYFKANIDGKEILWQAGLNNYRIFSSYAQDSNKVYNLISELKQTNCNGNCANSLRLQINDFKISQSGASIIIDSALTTKNYSFADSLIGNELPVQFNSYANKDVESYSWDFGDGSSSNLANPSHMYKTQGKYRVFLRSTSINGNISSIWNEINISNSKALNANITATVNSSKTIVFSSQIYGGISAQEKNWNYGDGTTDTGSISLHTFPVEGSYPVQLSIIDKNSSQTLLNYNAVTEKDKSAFAINFTTKVGTMEKKSIALSKIFINYTDENGMVYNNWNKQKNVNNTFEILSVENFDLNENNQPTKKIKIKFNCTLYNGSKTLNISNAEAIFALAYK